MTGLAVVLGVLCGAAISGIAFYLIFFSARKNEDAERQLHKEELRNFIEISVGKLESERLKQSSGLEESRRAVESSVTRLSEELKSYEKMVRDFEGDRRQKYGLLENGIGKLSETTDKLRSLLDNTQARGQWGERMADDILRACGLEENVQYLKNRAQETSTSRPDFTFLLPEGHKLNMDVKFPLDNYLRMAGAPNPEEAEKFKAEFLRDVKDRIKEISKRDYINPAESTLDYVLLFIPNEQVYGFIHQNCPGLIDESLALKTVLVSPFTLYAVLSIVRQSFDNFYFTQRTQEILKLVSAFSSAYERFRARFVDLGDKMEKARSLYHDIEDKSFRQLEGAIGKIERSRSGKDEEVPVLPLKPGDD